MKLLILWLFNKRIEIGLVTSIVLSLLLLVVPTVQAGYQPPRDRKPTPKDARSDSGTIRGCEGGELPPTILASHNYAGKTTSTHPIFAWFIPDSKPLPMQFTLYGFDSNGKPIEVYTLSLESSPGITQLSPLAKDKPGLEVGKTYFWQVVIFCDPDSPSSALFDRASIEVVEMPPQLSGKLEAAMNSVQKANLYAEAGLWYDALGEALKLAPEGKLGEVGANLVQDLANSEKPTQEPNLSSQERQNLEKRIENLRAIVESAR